MSRILSPLMIHTNVHVHVHVIEKSKTNLDVQGLLVQLLEYQM